MDLMSILPNGASYLQFLHFGQSMRFGEYELIFSSAADLNNLSVRFSAKQIE